MSVRFLNPKNVTHAGQPIAKVREVRIDARMTDVRRYYGDGAAYPKHTAAFLPTVDITVVTEDAMRPFTLVAGLTAELRFEVIDAETGATKTITAVAATYVGPSEEFGGPKSGPAVATMPFACWNPAGGNPITIS